MKKIPKNILKNGNSPIFDLNERSKDYIYLILKINIFLVDFKIQNCFYQPKMNKYYSKLFKSANETYRK